MNPVYDVALKLIQQGYSVFPVSNVDKRPFIAFSWKQYQTTPPTFDEVARWEKDYPDAMLAQVCGFKGFVFLDIDIKDVDKESPEGVIRQEIIDALVSQFADAPMVKTPSGGLHIHFVEEQPTPKIINLLDQFGNPCGEIRPDTGHYTVIPPSVTKEGYKYEYINNVDKPKQVGNLAEYLKSVLDNLGVTYAGVTTDTGYKEPINSNIKDPIKFGQRDDTLFRIACSLRNTGMDEQGIYEGLQRHNGRCVSEDGVTPKPLEDFVLRGKARDAARKYPIGDNGVVKPLQQPIAPPKKEPILKVDTMDLLEMVKNEPPMEYLEHLGRRDVWVNGWSHLLVAPPKTGKTTLLDSLVRDCVACGKTVNIISEEGRNVWAQRLSDRPYPARGVSISFAMGHSHDEILLNAQQSTENIIIIDTVRILGFADENSASEVQTIITPFVTACREKNQTFIMSQHGVKGERSVGMKGAGSLAISGIVDVIIEISREDKNNVSATKRKVDVLTRVNGDSHTFIYEMRQSELVYVGDTREVEIENVMDRILDVMPVDFVKTSEVKAGLTDPIPGRTNFDSALWRLANKGLILREPPIEEGAISGARYKWKLAPVQQQIGETQMEIAQDLFGVSAP
jgi:hypothetical protein